MKLLTTTLGSYLTGSDIADAVIDYGYALAQERRVDLIDIPITVDHTTTRLRLTIGWQIQVHALGVSGDGVEMIDENTTAYLRARTAELTVATMGGADGWDLGFDALADGPEL